MSDEPVPCGSIASVTHCCEYHGIHSDDDVMARIALLEVQLEAARDAATVAVQKAAELEARVQTLLEQREEILFMVTAWVPPATPEQVAAALRRHRDS